MAGLWPTEAELPGFQADTLASRPNAGPGMRVLSCFADKLGMERDFFTRAHNPASPHYQSTLRMLRYFAPQPGQEPGAWRAGAHTDFDCLTLLFQRPGQGGCRCCPARKWKAVPGPRWSPWKA
jgi:isopenicillin N synthase-like dioxygenase